MTKIMLVEDDKSLREIYGVRLLAEGYDIVSAGDGEEALAMAIKERPKLIVSDVMMPKISGFDMLDILRSTTETKDIKVIMMTALSSEDQRNRGQSLGADRYLIKSQVGIEDVVQVVHEVLGDKEGEIQPTEKPAQAQPVSQQSAAPPAPVQQQFTAPQPAAPSPPPAAPGASPDSDQPVAQRGFQFQSGQAPQQNDIPRPTLASPINRPNVQKPVGSSNRIIQPLNNPSIENNNIGELLDKELADAAGLTEENRPTIETVEQEKAALNNQINQYIQTPGPDEAAQLPTPEGSAAIAPETPEATSDASESTESMPQPTQTSAEPQASETAEALEALKASQTQASTAPEAEQTQEEPQDNLSHVEIGSDGSFVSEDPTEQSESTADSTPKENAEAPQQEATPSDASEPSSSPSEDSQTPSPENDETAALELLQQQTSALGGDNSTAAQSQDSTDQQNNAASTQPENSDPIQPTEVIKSSTEPSLEAPIDAVQVEGSADTASTPETSATFQIPSISNSATPPETEDSTTLEKSSPASENGADGVRSIAPPQEDEPNQQTPSSEQPQATLPQPDMNQMPAATPERQVAAPRFTPSSSIQQPTRSYMQPDSNETPAAATTVAAPSSTPSAESSINPQPPSQENNTL